MEGFKIPIGGDFAPLQAAFDAVIAAVEAMGNKIADAMDRSSAASAKAAAGMMKLQSGSTGVAAAVNSAGAATASASQKFMTAASTAGNLGHAIAGVGSGITTLNRATRAMTGMNLAATFTSWMRSAGGLRGALTALPGILRRIASNRTFQVVAAGAVAAFAAVVTLRTAFRVVSVALRALRATAAGVFRGMVSAASAAGRGIGNAFRGIASMPGKMLGSIPGLPIVGLLGAGTAVAVLSMQLRGASKDAAVFEDMRISVEQFTGSAEAAKTLLDDLATFAIKTPFETGTVQATATGLLGAGIKDDVAGITKDLAAMASTGQQLGELGDAVGKGFAKGKFQTEELNKFLERGINLLPALRAETGLTGEAFTKAVEKGLTFSQVTRAIRSMSTEGGQFYGMLEKRSQSFNGLISTLVAAWTDVRKAFGTPINDALKPILQAGIDRITSLMEKAKQLGEKVGNAISLVFAAFQGGKQTELFRAGLSVAIMSAIDLLSRGLRGAVAFLATALPPIFAILTEKLSDPTFWEGISLLFQGIAASFAAEIRKALGQNDLAESLGRQAEMQQKHGGMLIAGAGNANTGEVIKNAIGEALKAAKQAASGEKSGGLIAAESALAKLMASLQATVDANKPPPSKDTGTAIGAGIITPDSAAATVNKAVAPAVMSLSRIGGGGMANTVFNNLIGETKKQTGVLTKILTTLSQPARPISAKYA